MKTVILDDTAVLRTETGFIRPSDASEYRTIKLLCVPANDYTAREYRKFTVKRVLKPYTKLRVTSGVYLNIGGNTSMFLIQGCGKRTHAIVKPVKLLGRKTKYAQTNFEDITEGYESNYMIDLSDYTNKKSGLYNLANKDLFRFLGWYFKSGRKYESNGSYKLSTKNESVEYYKEIAKRLGLTGEAKTGTGRTTFKFYESWFFDLVTELIGAKNPKYITDEICLECGKELAKAFRDGFINCCKTDNNFKHLDRDRYEYAGSVESMGDLSLVWNKAGFNVTTCLHRNESGYTIRMEEVKVPFFDYITEIEVVKSPKEMYEIIPAENMYTGIWVQNLRFLAAQGTKDN